jgi:hypothetical protein
MGSGHAAISDTAKAVAKTEHKNDLALALGPLLLNHVAASPNNLALP